MNTKICTTIEQSKKLLELGIDKNTADFYYRQFCEPNLDYSNEGNSSGKPFYPTEPSLRHRNPIGTKTYINGKLTDIGGTLDSFKPGDIPCWSLAALLNYLRDINFFPNIEADENSVIMSIDYFEDEDTMLLTPIHNITIKAETFVDACYEMIVKVHELKLL